MTYSPDFIDLVQAALLGQRAHIAARDGSAPAHLMFSAGWRPTPSGPYPSGERLGWHLGVVDAATVRTDPDHDLIAFIPEQLRRHTGIALYDFEAAVSSWNGWFWTVKNLDRLPAERKVVAFQAALFGLSIIDPDLFTPDRDVATFEAAGS